MGMETIQDLPAIFSRRQILPLFTLTSLNYFSILINNWNKIVFNWKDGSDKSIYTDAFFISICIGEAWNNPHAEVKKKLYFKIPTFSLKYGHWFRKTSLRATAISIESDKRSICTVRVTVTEALKIKQTKIKSVKL